jgi:hypothetical protein
MADESGWGKLARKGMEALAKPAQGAAMLYGGIKQALANTGETIENPGGALEPLAEQMAPPLDDPDKMVEYAMNINPVMGMGGMIVGKGAKGFNQLRRVNDIYTGMEKAEMNDQLAKLTPAMKQRFANTKRFSLDEIEALDKTGNYPPEEMQMLLRNFQGKHAPRSLDVLFDHPELYKNYPDAARIQTKFAFDDKRSKAWYNPDEDSITLNLSGMNSEEDILESLMHEIQHAVQEREGFAGGISPDFFTDAKKTQAVQRAFSGQSPIPKGMKQRDLAESPIELYRRTVGEIEARDTSYRRLLSDTERAKHPVYKSQGVDPKDAIHAEKWMEIPGLEDELLVEIMKKMKGKQ